MFVKIKELPEKLKKKACKRMFQEREIVDEDCVLSAAFDWGNTKEGIEFWGNVCEEYSEITIEKLLGGMAIVDIKVKDAKEVKPDSIVESVVSQLRDRSDVGIKKYGTTLDREDLNFGDWIQNALEESMDLTLYLTKIKKEWEQNRTI